MAGDFLVNRDPMFLVQSNLTKIGLNVNTGSQLKAIRDLLHRNRAADADLNEQITRAEKTAASENDLANVIASDQAVSLMHESVFQGAAHSMAAAGMLAPFLETIFFQCFRGIGSNWAAVQTLNCRHERWQSAHAIQWDCHNVIVKGRSRTDLVQGILQLADTIGLLPLLPATIEETLSALYAYRNKMFHHGFEWPPEERAAFQKRIDESKWPSTWFERATVNREPWIFYMSDVFIEHGLNTADEVLMAFAEFVCDHMAGLPILSGSSEVGNDG